ncbi:DUF2971 domain-containing protein [Aeromonas hydrophila]|uniref:DUF2971 domain-containing protein n=1 Tax=Aeromonas hydrophila TaxID=644 RepID=UPI00211D7073|nr:DUF2971 domain-containing protein [Aeromonas hydrophila]MCX4113271.1 DUF2971 domain-containing protein [Aeromonas hydrophila]UUM71290.1 DUF2971 domain-containing protein [Aeromonas hydrophila]
MDTLYKYTRNFGVDFFKKPKVKLSNPSYLNDPFESEACDNLINVISENKMPLRYSKADIRELTNEVMKSYGIFSLSETPRNPLMWAHYANEHRGICIGYNRNLFSKIEKPKDSIYLMAEYEPRKINYDNYRFDKEKKISSSDDFVNAIKSQLLTKSDEWIYEKEHRCIIPFVCSTSFIVDNNSTNTVSHFDKEMTINEYLPQCIKEGLVKKIGLDEYELSNRLNKNEQDIYTSAFSTFGCVSFLYNIDPQSIYSIHLGFRTSDTYVNEIYSMINEEGSKLSHVKLYKFHLSEKRFELLPEIVDEQYILKMNKKRHSR